MPENRREEADKAAKEAVHVTDYASCMAAGGRHSVRVLGPKAYIELCTIKGKVYSGPKRSANPRVIEREAKSVSA